MWIFTRGGFVSIVRHREDGDRVLVRARTREHLEAFLAPGPTGTIQQTPAADYRYRITLPASYALGLLSAHFNAATYPDFKSSLPHGDAAEDAYASACGSVWSVMGRLQEGGPYGARAAAIDDLFADDLPDDDAALLPGPCRDCGAPPGEPCEDWCFLGEGTHSSGPTL